MVASTSPGTIEPGVLYVLAEVQQRMRWGKSALRSARHQGLKTVKIGSRTYCLGDDVIAFVKSQRDAGQ